MSKEILSAEDCPPCPECGFDIWWNGKCFYCHPPKLKGFTVDVICAWCGANMGKKDGFQTPEPTHGMCQGCYKETVSQHFAEATSP